MENTNQKFGTLVATLQAMVETGHFVIDLQKNVTSTSYRTGSLEQALQRQVIEEMVHDLGAESDEQPRRRIKIQILGLDNETTIERKIEIANDMFNGVSVEITPGMELRNSDRLLDCLDGYFGVGPELDRQYFQAKEDAAAEATAQANTPSNDEVEQTSSEDFQEVENPAENDTTGLAEEPNTSGDN